MQGRLGGYIYSSTFGVRCQYQFSDFIVVIFLVFLLLLIQKISHDLDTNIYAAGISPFCFAFITPLFVMGFMVDLYG